MISCITLYLKKLTNLVEFLQQIPQFVSQQTSDMMHKLLDLQNFNVYWDTDAALTIPSDREITMAELEVM